MRVGDAAGKRWWRHFVAPQELQVYAGQQATASAKVADNGATTVAITLTTSPPLRDGAC